MRIITWNCNMRFKEKEEAIKKFSPDIAIIQECENLDMNSDHMLWYGDNIHKGIGVFVYRPDLKVETYDGYDKEIKYVIPIVMSGKFKFNLLAIWTKNSNIAAEKYVRCLHKAMPVYEEFIKDKPTIMIGDFNSNSIWDKLHGSKNHTELVKILENKFSMKSIYHSKLNEEHGHETMNTLFMYRNKNKGYHIDYCFMPDRWIKNVTNLSIGEYENWNGYSDHVPMIIDIEDKYLEQIG